MADDLKPMLTKLLASKGEKRFFFAYGTGARKDGKGEGELIVRGKKPKKTDVEEDLADTKEVFEGFCWTGNGPENGETIYFQARGKKLSPTIVTKMTKTAKSAVGRQYDFQMPTPEEEARAGQLALGGEEAPKETPPPAPPSTPAPSGDAGAAQFTARLKLLAQLLPKAEASNPEAARSAKLHIAEANRQFLAKQYEPANAALDLADAQIKQALAQPATGMAAPPTDAARFATRLKALAPELQKAEAMAPEQARAAKLQVVEANKFYVAKQLEQAHAALDQAEALLRKKDGAGEFTQRLERLGAARDEALQQKRGDAGQMNMLFDFAQDKGTAGNYPAAMQALDRLEKLLATAAPPKTDGASKLVKQRQFMLTRWSRIPAELKAELGQLKKAIVTQNADQNPDELTGALESCLLELIAEIQEDLDDAINRGDMSVFAGLRASVADDPLIQHLEAAPNVDGARFKNVILGAMAEIESALAA